MLRRVAEVTRTWRSAIDACLENPDAFAVREEWMARLSALSEGQQHTLGPYNRRWR